MHPANKISVIIITKNEEANIEDCLTSVAWADEIIVVDSESSDRTVELAKKFTSNVFTRKWSGYSDQKSYALSLAKNEFVLSIDADERITDELKKEIITTDLSGFDGYLIKRDNYFLGKKIYGCGWNKDYQLRIFRSSKTKLTDRKVHEKFIVDGNISRLKNVMIHYSYTNFEDAFNKINYYSTLSAEEKFKRKKVNGFTIIAFPAIAFFQFFILKRGFIDGIYGVFVSLLHTLTKTMMYLKIWELRKKNGLIK